MSDVTTKDHRADRGFYGVYVDGRPAGRVRESSQAWAFDGEPGRFRAFTNLRSPGNQLLGAFPSLEAAAERVAEERRS